MRTDTTTAILLYDGDCGLCNATVRFILRHERRSKALLFAPLQGRTAHSWISQKPELATVDSVVWIEPRTGTALVRWPAVRRVLGHLGGPWRLLAGVAAVVPTTIGDWCYDQVAVRRHRWWPRSNTCTPAPPAQRGRFLD